MGQSNQLTDVFLAFSELDRDWSMQLAEELKRNGLSVSVYREAVPHPNSEEYLRLAEAARAIIVVWSEVSIDSTAEYRSETMRRTADLGASKHRLLPVAFSSDVTPERHRDVYFVGVSTRGVEEVGRLLVDRLRETGWLREVTRYNNRREPGRPTTMGGARTESPGADAEPPEILTPGMAPLEQLARKREAYESARADATAFAPKYFRRSTPELVRIFVHRPEELRKVEQRARISDPRAQRVPDQLGLGSLRHGTRIGVQLEISGAVCKQSAGLRVWNGEILDFDFIVEPNVQTKQVVCLARISVGNAQIGTIAFVRKVRGRMENPKYSDRGLRMRRYERVFLSYSSRDRETVSQISATYRNVGIKHFWDRASLSPGQEWGPRLMKEIDRCDLFHLCWSQSAAESRWVEREAVHALERRRRRIRKRPDITVQMLDGPPWAPHPQSLDVLNFDDYHRAAIVGYGKTETTPLGVRLFGLNSAEPQIDIEIPHKIAARYGGVVLGRNGEEADFLLNDQNLSVSRRHIRLSWNKERQSYEIEDLRSTNGTIVDGLRLKSGDPKLLKDDSILRLGLLEVRVSILIR